MSTNYELSMRSREITDKINKYIPEIPMSSILSSFVYESMIVQWRNAIIAAKEEKFKFLLSKTITGVEFAAYLHEIESML